MPTGRYAPSPSGPLHVGNLRTALLAWLFATADPRAPGGELRLRIDDLDPRTVGTPVEAEQLADLAAIGVEFSGPVLRQSERFDRYQAVVDELAQQVDTYPCFCSRREIREAAQAPHAHLPEGAYPGTCRDLSSAERSRRAEDRPAALRVRAGSALVAYDDRLHGRTEVEIDDFVIVRNDGVFSYNVATVVDDADQAITQVVRGADLLEGTGRQVWLRERLGLQHVEHAHVPLMINAESERLAKRDGAVTLAELTDLGYDATDVRAMLLDSLGLATNDGSTDLHDVAEKFDPTSIGTDSTIWTDPPRRAQKNSSDAV